MVADGLPYMKVVVQRIIGSDRRLENGFCSYQLKKNLKNSSDCLFGPTIGQWYKYPSKGSSASYSGAPGRLQEISS